MSADLFGALAGIPRFDAACVGSHALFDPQEQGETDAAAAARHRAALAICSRCSSAERCRDWFIGLPVRKRPLGVCAGLLNPPKQRRQRRERTA